MTEDSISLETINSSGIALLMQLLKSITNSTQRGREAALPTEAVTMIKHKHQTVILDIDLIPELLMVQVWINIWTETIVEIDFSISQDQDREQDQELVVEQAIRLQIGFWITRMSPIMNMINKIKLSANFIKSTKTSSKANKNSVSLTSPTSWQNSTSSATPTLDFQAS